MVPTWTSAQMDGKEKIRKKMKRNEREEPNTKLTQQALKFPAATGSIEMIENIDWTLDMDWIGVDWIGRWSYLI